MVYPTFINPNELKKAAIYANEQFLSTPFTCPNPLRTRERAICLLADNRIVDGSSFVNPDGSVNLKQVSQ